METDWNKYYQARPFPYSPTRKITEKLVLSEILKVEKKKFRLVMELGGGDSYLYPAFRRHYPNMHYFIVDKSEQGVNKFLKKNQKDYIKVIHEDLLNNPKLPQVELVYSLGLIEHFEPPETKKIIKAHFDAVLPGGLVLITFPTPTWLYRLLRTMLELLNWWPFHDERPLLEEEVLNEVEKHGTILTKKMNWYIGLTQKIIVARRFYEEASA